MTNPSKAKGTAAETAVVRYARANGFPQAARCTAYLDAAQECIDDLGKAR